MPGGVKKCTICKENKKFSDFDKEPVNGFNPKKRKYLDSCKECVENAVELTLDDADESRAKFEIERLKRVAQYQNSIKKQYKETVEA